MPTDKLLHFLVGAVIGFTVSILFGWILSGIVVVLAAIGKEVYDKFVPEHTVDKWDAVSTIAGGCFAFCISF